MHDNQIEVVGNNGLLFTGSNSSAERNYVSQAVSLLNDGAGITFDHCDQCGVHDNIVVDSHGALDGAAKNSGNYERKGYGIYFGNHDIRNTLVQGNTLTGCAIGILVDHGQPFQGNEVLDNTVFDCSESQLAVQDLGLHGGYYQQQYDTEFSGNVLYCLNSKQVCLHEDQTNADSYAGTNPFTDFGTYNNNYYFNPFNEAVIHQRGYFPYAATFDQYTLGTKPLVPWTLAGWQARPDNQDADSHTSPLRLNDWKAVSYSALNNTLSADMEQPSAPTQWDDHCGTVAYVTAGTEHFIHATDCVYLQKDQSVPATPATNQGWYSFKFRMRSDHATALQQTPLYNTTDKYQRPNIFGVTDQWRNYELLGDANNMQTTAPADVLLTAFQDLQYAAEAQPNSSLYLDDVQVAKVVLEPDYDQQIAQEHILRYNCPIADPSTQNAGGSFIPGVAGQCWSDVYGNHYPGDVAVALQPWESKVLFLDPTCCPADITVANNTLSSSLGTPANTTISNTTLAIEGVFVVDNELLISNTTVYMKPGAEITVQPDAFSVPTT
ncbi:MAG: hypothetical protein IT230_05475 [Flavobacteriales bacterium]|nr:hypothetical protein [Flavobacteriales bacterium]